MVKHQKHSNDSFNSDSLKDSSLPPFHLAEKVANEDKLEEFENAQQVRDIANKTGPLTTDEASILLKDLERKRDLMKDKLDKLYEARGMTPTALHDYITNQNNFSKEQWEFIQKERRELIESMNIPEEFSSIKKNLLEGKSKEAPKKGKSGKSRRGWMPMR